MSPAISVSAAGGSQKSTRMLWNFWRNHSGTISRGFPGSGGWSTTVWMTVCGGSLPDFMKPESITEPAALSKQRRRFSYNKENQEKRPEGHSAGENVTVQTPPELLRENNKEADPSREKLDVLYKVKYVGAVGKQMPV